jgi:hypothetical protein
MLVWRWLEWSVAVLLSSMEGAESILGTAEGRPELKEA